MTAFAALDGVLAMATNAVTVPVKSSDVLLHTRQDFSRLCPFVSVHADFEIGQSHNSGNHTIEVEEYTLTAWVVAGDGTNDHADNRAAEITESLKEVFHGYQPEDYRPFTLTNGNKEVLPGVVGHSLTYQTRRISSRKFS
jgi:hypothetical protein